MDNPKDRIEIIIQRVVLGLFIVGIIGLLSFVGVSIFFLAPVDPNCEETIEFTVQEGWSKSTIADELQEVELIRNSFFFKFYMRINDKQMFAGTYRLSRSMSVDEIIRTLNSTSNSLENETITVTFIEGRRLTNYVSRIVDNFEHEEEEVWEILSNEDYLRELIDQYWFLTDAILHEYVRHPLEGYFFPDTYNFRKSASVEDIVERMLSNMETRLAEYEDDINAHQLSVHEIITFASIVQTEGPADEQANIAGVFFNRLAIGDDMGSCVTTYYAVNKEMGDGLTHADLNVCNPYNTRGRCRVPGLPIGPIASPGLTAIAATIYPEDHDYHFFVSDSDMNIHFSKTYGEHNATIRRLRSAGKWLEL